MKIYLLTREYSEGAIVVVAAFSEKEKADKLCVNDFFHVLEYDLDVCDFLIKYKVKLYTSGVTSIYKFLAANDRANSKDFFYPRVDYLHCEVFANSDEEAIEKAKEAAKLYLVETKTLSFKEKGE